jgi:nucleoside 2-deoxyribosyltransferase
MTKPQAFLICPVRGHDPAETAAVVAQLEAAGWAVHWPPRDTEQEDPTGGLAICQANRAAIARAERVFVIYDGKSEGCLFDLGMAFALHKPVTILACPPVPEGKSFAAMMRAWAEATAPDGA